MLHTFKHIPAWMQHHYQEAKLNRVPAWFKNLSAQAWNNFSKTGLPTKKDERWKYVDLAFLQQQDFVYRDDKVAVNLNDQIKKYKLTDAISLVFVNGHFSEDLSDTQQLPKEFIVMPFAEALLQYENIIKPVLEAEKHTGAFTQLNFALQNTGLFFYVPQQACLEKPIHLLFLSTSANALAIYPKHIFVLDKASKLTLFEEHLALQDRAYFSNNTMHITLQRDAALTYYKLQNENIQTTHIAHTLITQKENSKATLMHFALGAQCARDDIVINLEEKYAGCATYGCYHLKHEHQQIDYHLDINHFAAQGESNMTYKGIIDKKSRAIFNGRLFVNKAAEKTVAYQANHNLLLHPQAEVYTKPELEIYADDVKCKHGATIGQLDADALFYLRARGVAEEDAIQILVDGFLADMLEKIPHANVKAYLQEKFSYVAK